MAKKLKRASTAAQTDEFEFVDAAGRTFTCSREAVGATRPDQWWWFRVSTDPRNQRYALFRIEPGDTRENVQARIVAYYDELEARRSAPPTTHHWGRRPGVPAVPLQVAEAAGEPPLPPDA